VKNAFEIIFSHEGITPAFVEGDSYHRYNRQEMDDVVKTAELEGKSITHFGPEGNLFDELESLFQEYSQSGTGKRRYYIHDDTEAALRGTSTGMLTEWEDLPENTDLLFYEGLHGAVITDGVNVHQYVDLLIGVTPIINLEWMQKIQRDKEYMGYSPEDATELILSRMHDYTHYITPQFSRTDINFQRVPTVDTSNPFAARKVPTNDESFVVIHIRNQEKIKVDFQDLLKMLDGSFMTTLNTIVVPAGKMIFAMQLITDPLIQDLMKNKGSS
ncbi:MAG: phosphoribulokinase, partial [Gammaproteobacteria bacterium]